MQQYPTQTTHHGFQDENPSPNNKHIQDMQWAMLLIFALLTTLSLTLPTLAYILSGNWITLTPAAGSIPFGLVWYWIAKRVFPLNKQDHERELEKIKHKKKPD